jgi:N-acetylglutamate synthase-like GNAT family acetyltransferase
MPTHPVTIRSATLSDWPHIAALLQSHALPLEGAQEHLGDFFLAVCGDSLIGSAGMEVYAGDALLRSVAVMPDQQGHGVGRMLVSHLIDEAKRRHVTALYLLTTSAADYFERLGFQHLDAQQAPATLKQSVEFQGVCPSSAVLMRLPLSP